MPRQPALISLSLTASAPMEPRTTMRPTSRLALYVPLALALGLAACAVSPPAQKIRPVASTPTATARVGLARIDDAALQAHMLADAPGWLLLDLAGTRRIAHGASASTEGELASTLTATLLEPVATTLDELGLADSDIALATFYPLDATPWLLERRRLLAALRDTTQSETRRIELVSELLAPQPDDAPLLGARLFVDTPDPQRFLESPHTGDFIELDAAALGLEGVVRVTFEDDITPQERPIYFVLWARPGDGGLLVDLTAHTAPPAPGPDLERHREATAERAVRKLAADTWPSLRAGLPTLARPQPPAVFHLGVDHGFLSDLIVLGGIEMAFQAPSAEDIRVQLGNLDALLTLAAGPAAHPLSELTLSWGSGAPRTQTLELLTRFETPVPDLARALAVPAARIPLGSSSLLVDLSGHLTGKLSSATDPLQTQTPLVQLLNSSEAWMVGAFFTAAWSAPTLFVSTAPLWTASLPQLLTTPPQTVVVAIPSGVPSSSNVVVGSVLGSDRTTVESFVSCIASGFDHGAQCHTMPMPADGETTTIVRGGQPLDFGLTEAAGAYLGVVATSAAHYASLRDTRREPSSRLFRLCVGDDFLDDVSMQAGVAMQLDLEIRSEGIAWRLDLVEGSARIGAPLCPLR